MSRVLFVPSLLCAAALLSACQPMALNRRAATAPAPGAPAAATPVAAPVAQSPQRSQQGTVAPVEFYIAQTQSAQGLTQVRLSDGSIWVQQQPALTRNDLSGVGPVKSPQGQPFVQFNFNQGGAQKLADLTKQNTGRFLVLSINGTLAAMPRIAEPLTNGVLLVPVQNDQIAMNISNAVRGASPAPTK